jgi:ABC-type branched-subunit amino acid transport system ATPase component
MMLEVSGLDAFYGQNQALYGVDFSLDEGRIRTLLGANGAGKTTVLRAICGMVRTAAISGSTGSASPVGRPRTSSGSASAMCRRDAAPSCG